MNKILILGANGRFGRATTQAFTDAGWQVTKLVRPGKGQGGDTIEADASDPVALSKAAQGFDVLIHALNPPYDKWAKELPRLTAAVIAAARSSGATVLFPGNVYNFGLNLPPVLDENTSQTNAVGKGALRADMERSFREAGDVRTIVLRAGDFIEATRTNGWFDDQITNNVHSKGSISYPGPLDAVHAWAYLPDMARAAVGLCEIRETLPTFSDVPFEGFSLTGEQLITAVEAGAGKTLKRKNIPWGIMALLGVFIPLVKEVIAMRYLWNMPHRLDGTKLARLLPDFKPTSLKDAMKQVLQS